jgi:hypothetical protein
MWFFIAMITHIVAGVNFYDTVKGKIAPLLDLIAASIVN